MKILLCLLTSFLFLNSLSAQEGSLDLSFGMDGVLQENQSMNLSAVAIQNDGKIVCIGPLRNNQFSNTVVILRYNEDGNLDNSFGTNGRVEKEIDAFTTYSDVIVLSNGDIMLSGSIFQQAFFAKLDTDGNFKTDFGDDGIMTDLGINSDFQSALMHLTDDEEIYLLHGYTQDGSAAPAISKWKTDGTRITDFGTNGEVQFDKSFGKEPTAMESDDQDNIYAMYRNGSVIKMDKNGNLDTNFGTDGYLLTGPGTTLPATFTGLKSQDNILYIYGYSLLDYYVRKIDASGEAVSEFGSNGVIQGQWDNLYSLAYGIYLLEDNSIIVGGEIRTDNTMIDMSLVKYDEDGDLDNSFGTNGIIRTQLEGNNVAATYTSNKEGTVLLFGQQNTWPEPGINLTAHRYNLEVSLNTEEINQDVPLISIYPNPTSDQVSISFPDWIITSYEIVNLEGKTIKTSRQLNSQHSIDIKLSEIPAGSYILNLVFDNGTSSSHQLIKQD